MEEIFPMAHRVQPVLPVVHHAEVPVAVAVVDAGETNKL